MSYMSTVPLTNVPNHLIKQEHKDSYQTFKIFADPWTNCDGQMSKN